MIDLDSYGEEDIGLKRERPLHLCKERLLELSQLVSAHMLPQVIVKRDSMARLSVQWRDM